MTRSVKTKKPSEPEAFGFSLANKRRQAARKREIVLAHSENLRIELERNKGRINWDQLRQADSEDKVKVALAGLDEFTRERLPNNAAILAAVNDPACPKIRWTRFLAESTALALQSNPRNAKEYKPRYSRDICYRERKRRGTARKPISDLEFWSMQDALGQGVPVKYLRRINKKAKEQQSSAKSDKSTYLPYTDIPSRVKKRTTVWLPESMVSALKQLSARNGAPMAELFRRAIAAYLKTR